MLDKKPFYFLRHGQTDWNAERLCQGQTDIPLNAIGVQQAGEAKAHLADIAITTVCSSPLGRALETAKTVSEIVVSGLVITIDRWDGSQRAPRLIRPAPCKASTLCRDSEWLG